MLQHRAATRRSCVRTQEAFEAATRRSRDAPAAALGTKQLDTQPPRSHAPRPRRSHVTYSVSRPPRLAEGPWAAPPAPRRWAAPPAPHRWAARSRHGRRHLPAKRCRDRDESSRTSHYSFFQYLFSKPIFKTYFQYLFSMTIFDNFFRYLFSMPIFDAYFRACPAPYFRTAAVSTCLQASRRAQRRPTAPTWAHPFPPAPSRPMGLPGPPASP